MEMFIGVKSFDLTPALSLYVGLQTPPANYGLVLADEVTRCIKTQMISYP